MNRVNRGSVYKYENDGVERIAMVISRDSELWDKYCSIIFMIPNPNTGCVEVDLNGEVMYANPCFATYTKLTNLVDYICKVDAETSEKIDRILSDYFGLRTEHDRVQAEFYKEQYTELLSKVVNNYDIR